MSSVIHNRFNILGLVKKIVFLFFLQGNIQRSQLVVEQLGDSRKSMVKVRRNVFTFLSIISVVYRAISNAISGEGLDKDVSEVQS